MRLVCLSGGRQLALPGSAALVPGALAAPALVVLRAAVTLAPPLVLPVLPTVLPVTAPVNLASSSSCLLGSRLCSSSMGTSVK